MESSFSTDSSLGRRVSSDRSKRVPQELKTKRCDERVARDRHRYSTACILTAELILDEGSEEFRTVAASLSVLAGIAAADSICCRRLHRMHRGSDHNKAVDLLQEALPKGSKDGAALSRLLDMKAEAHYGVYAVSGFKARNALRWAKQLHSVAQLELVR
jgi:hypothetical protein